MSQEKFKKLIEGFMKYAQSEIMAAFDIDKKAYFYNKG